MKAISCAGGEFEEYHFEVDDHDRNKEAPKALNISEISFEKLQITVANTNTHVFEKIILQFFGPHAGQVPAVQCGMVAEFIGS